MTILLLFFGGGGGGDSSVFLALAHEYQRLGLKPTLAARSEDQLLFERANRLGLELLCTPSWKLLDRSIWRAADVVHLHYCASFIGGRDALAIRTAMKRTQKLICTLHGPNPATECMRSVLHRQISRIASRVVDQFIVPSTQMSEHARAFFPRDTRVATVANPVLEPRKVTKAEAKKELGLDPEARVIGYLGAISPRKRPLDVLRAAALLPRNDLYWVFAGSGESMDECRSYAEANSVRALFLGQVVDPAPLLRASDVFVFPSERENKPISVLEAALVGIPIVASNLPTLRQEFEGAKSVHLHRVGDIQSLADGVARFLDQDASPECTRLAATIAGKYSPSVVASEHLDLYTSLTSPSRNK